MPGLVRFGVAALLTLFAAGAAQAQQRRGLGDLSAYPGLQGVELQYDSIRIVGTIFYLSGDVDFVDPAHDTRLLADELQIDTDTLEFEATGQVSFEQGEMLLNGSVMSGDLDAGTLVMEDVIGIAPGPFYVRGRRIEQQEPGKFHVEGGVVTPCNQTTAIWEFRSNSMTVKPGSYVKMSWPHIRVKGVPIFGLPFLLWPLQESRRATGLLLPKIGTSNRRGFMVSESLFLATSRSTDLTLTYEHFAKAGNGFGGEFRYAFAGDGGGFIRSYYLPGRQLSAEQEAAGGTAFGSGFSINGAHLQSLPKGFILRARANIVSSTEFARSFSDDVDRFLQRQSLVSADISKSWGASTLTLVVDNVENFNNDQRSTIGRRLPQVKYTLRSTQLGGPLYVGLQASAARFEKLQKTAGKQSIKVDGGSYERFDAFPDMSLQLTQIPWLTFNPFFRWRSTYWTSSETRREFRFVDRSIWRNLYQTGIEMVGPSFFKIFDTESSQYSPRLKHVIQPRLVYENVHQFKVNDSRIIQFDEVDSRVSDRQEVRFEITTRLFAKRYLNPTDEQRQVWQIAELTMGRRWDLEKGSLALEEAGAPRVLLPYFMTMIIQPTGRLYLRTTTNFTPDWTPANISVNGTINAEGGRIGLTWFRGVRDFLDPTDLTKVIVETSSNSLRADGNVDLFGRRLTLGGGVDVDLNQDTVQNINGSVSWNLQCCSIGLTLQRLNFTGRQETQFSFLLNLAQVGQFGFDNQRR